MSSEQSQPAPGSHRTADIDEGKYASLARGLGSALAEGDIGTAEGILRLALDDELPAPAILSRVIGPAMYEIGSRWERCDLTVADEHLATAVCHQLLAVVYEHLLVARARSRAGVLLACVEGEQHSLGLRMAADVLEGAGYEVFYLGANVPSDALLDAVVRFRPALVGLSATSEVTAAIADGLVARLRSIDDQLVILLGGQGFPSSSPPASGVEVHRDVEGLIHVAEVLAAREAHAPEAATHGLLAAPATPRAADSTHAGQLEATTASLADLARRLATSAYGLRLDALQDALTGLWNRRAFDDRLRALIDDPAARPLSLLLIDLDAFKSINDGFGHQVGDEALQRVADTLRRVTRGDDFVARLGGDEFVAIFPRTSLAKAERVAERLRGLIAAESSPHFTVSVGVKDCTGDPRSSMLAADISLYRAKSHGRDAVFVSR